MFFVVVVDISCQVVHCTLLFIVVLVILIDKLIVALFVPVNVVRRLCRSLSSFVIVIRRRRS